MRPEEHGVGIEDRPPLIRRWSIIVAVERQRSDRQVGHSEVVGAVDEIDAAGRHREDLRRDDVSARAWRRRGVAVPVARIDARGAATSGGRLLVGRFGRHGRILTGRLRAAALGSARRRLLGVHEPRATERKGSAADEKRTARKSPPPLDRGRERHGGFLDEEVRAAAHLRGWLSREPAFVHPSRKRSGDCGDAGR